MTRAAAEQGAASRIASMIEGLLEEQEHVVFGVPGGRSIAGIFKLLLEERVEWQKVHVFMVDERLVPLSSHESNFRQVKECLTDELLRSGKMPAANVHPFVFDPSAKDKGIGVYAAELKKLGGKYDIVLLSCGEDGHVGGLFPNLSVMKDAEYFLLMDDSPKPPAERMSFSRELLLQTNYGVLLFFGEGKRNAYRAFSDDETPWQECPAKLVKELGTHYVYTDF